MPQLKAQLAAVGFTLALPNTSPELGTIPAESRDIGSDSCQGTADPRRETRRNSEKYRVYSEL